MALRFKLDENIPARAVAALSTTGHDVHTAASEGLAGAHDRAVLEACIAESRLLVTLDLDFADIREYPTGSHRGIWVLFDHQTQVFARHGHLERRWAVLPAGNALGALRQRLPGVEVIEEAERVFHVDALGGGQALLRKQAD